MVGPVLKILGWLVTLLLSNMAYGDVESILEHCCEMGELWASDHTTCPAPVLDGGACLTSAHVCCVKTLWKMDCERGKGAAREGSPCGTKNSPYTGCCDGCYLGIDVGSQRLPCAFTRFSFGTPWNEAYLDCCERASAVAQQTSPSTPVERAPEPVTRAVVEPPVTLDKEFGYAELKSLKEKLEAQGYGLMVLDNRDLLIYPLNPPDEVEYTSNASNQTEKISSSTRSEVKRKTRITVAPENLEVAAGRSATFRCVAEADPSLQLNIEWMFNGVLIIDSRVGQTSDASLVISETLKNYSGEYTCVARTELDKAEASATLIVLDAPNPPKVLGVQCDGLNATVRWEPAGDGGAPILGYAVQYSTRFTPDQWVDAYVDVSPNDTMVKVLLSPWAKYKFRVIARNKVGVSEPSGHPDVCETPPDVPYKNPDNVVGKGTSKDNLIISWTAMPMIDQNAPGFFYRIFLKRKDDPGASWHQIDWDMGDQIGTVGQPTFTAYRIKVEAHNSKGQARTPATEVIGYSGEDVPLKRPKNFRLLFVSVSDPRSAMVSWDPVPPESLRGHFKGYKIQTWTKDEGKKYMREQIVAANVTKAIVTLFKPSARNIARVLAFNGMFDGPASKTIDFITPDGSPGPVAYFHAIPFGSTALFLKWKQPEKLNGVLSGYNIYYNEVNGTELGAERVIRIRDPTKTQLKLGGLKPKTKYRVEIHAITGGGQGEMKFREVQTNDAAEQL